MSRLKVLIADDETPARRRLRQLLNRVAGWSIVAETGDGQSTIASLERDQPDLLLLDIRMPDMNAFEVLRRVESEQIPQVIFVTAYDQHAVRAFEVQALDYLLKPFDDERFYQALERAREWIRAGKRRRIDLESLSRLSAGGNDNSTVSHRRLLVRHGSRNLFLAPEEIRWIGAEGVYIRLHCSERSYLLRRSLTSLEESLPPGFLRIHRSTIVNRHFIRSSRHCSHGDYEITLEDGTRLRASRTYRHKLSAIAGGSPEEDG